MMGKQTKVHKVYFIGIGYSPTSEDEIMEVRSLSSEMLVDSYSPALASTIHNSDIRYWKKKDLDTSLVQEIEKEQMYYREWIITENTFETLNQNSLFEIPPEYIQEENLRDIEKQLE